MNPETMNRLLDFLEKNVGLIERLLGLLEKNPRIAELLINAIVSRFAS